jgi:SAM-dependent methyltransferase
MTGQTTWDETTQNSVRASGRHSRNERRQTATSWRNLPDALLYRLRATRRALPVLLPRRRTPVSAYFGYDRGQPVDRYYIENFLAANAGDIRGRVLEIGDNSYTRQYGGECVTASDVLHVHEGNPAATIVADLAKGDNIPSDAFDCVILTQTLQLVYDVHAAVRTLHRILKPGGVVLATIPSITSIGDTDWEGTWFWGFTHLSAARLFGDVFPRENVTVEPHGNVLSATAFLYGLSSHELWRKELDHRDAHYQVTITVRAVKG